jgi:hypothetical protein
MAGDWIPIRLDLRRDPAVLRIATRLDMEIDLVVGKLVHLWTWASEQSRDGHAPVTPCHVNAMLSSQDFAEALVDEGWLEVTEAGIRIVHWNRWLSQSAKGRTLATLRKRKQRAGQERDTGVTESGPEGEGEGHEEDPPIPPAPQGGTPAPKLTKREQRKADLQQRAAAAVARVQRIHVAQEDDL